MQFSNLSEISPDYNSVCPDNNYMRNINEDNDVMHNDKSFVTLNSENNIRAELKDRLQSHLRMHEDSCVLFTSRSCG